MALRAGISRRLFRTPLLQLGPWGTHGMVRRCSTNNAAGDLRRELDRAIALGDTSAAAVAAAALARLHRPDAAPVAAGVSADPLTTTGEPSSAHRILCNVKSIDTTFVDTFAATSSDTDGTAAPDSTALDAAANDLLQVFLFYFPNELAELKAAIAAMVRTEVAGLVQARGPVAAPLEGQPPTMESNIAVSVRPQLHSDRTAIEVRDALRDTLSVAGFDVALGGTQKKQRSSSTAAGGGRFRSGPPQPKSVLIARESLARFLLKDYFVGAPTAAQQQQIEGDVDAVAHRRERKAQEQGEPLSPRVLKEVRQKAELVILDDVCRANRSEARQSPALYDVGVHEALTAAIQRCVAHAKEGATDGEPMGAATLSEGIEQELSRRILRSLNDAAKAGGQQPFLDTEDPPLTTEKTAVDDDARAAALLEVRNRTLGWPLPPFGMILRFRVIVAVEPMTEGDNTSTGLL